MCARAHVCVYVVYIPLDLTFSVSLSKALSFNISSAMELYKAHIPLFCEGRLTSTQFL